MKVKLKRMVRITCTNEYIDKDTILDVSDERGIYYICMNDKFTGVFIQKDDCEVLDND